MSQSGDDLREARLAAGISLSAMAARTSYTKGYLGLVETGQRRATSDVIDAYERVLGVGGLGDSVNRRDFLSVAASIATTAALVGEVAASIAGNDPGPLADVQTTYHTDRSIASVIDVASARHLRRWGQHEPNPVLRVNATGILAKLPGQHESELVSTLLASDEEIRNLYLTAVTARVCGLPFPDAATLVRNPRMFQRPALVAQRFTKEVVNPHDVGARWCSALMLQRLSPMIGR